ncbi:L-threonylcarbamoyladenylate synthase [Alsobacter sp. R-9]
MPDKDRDSAPQRQTRLLAADADGIAQAAALLREGGLVAFPTETVYGLGADATNARAVAALYAAKGRPSFNPLIAHVPDLETAFLHGVFDATATALARVFWPGPLTLVVPRRAESGVCDLVTAGLDSVGLRVPDHPVARQLLAAVGRPVAAPSANRSGRVSPTTARHVLEDLDGRIDAVLDGGATRVGVESTIVSCLADGPLLLRPGGIPRESLEEVAGCSLDTPARSAPDAPLAPGMLESHYAPRARVRLTATSVLADEAVLLFGPTAPAGFAGQPSVNLSPSGDVVEAAANLFGALRMLDATGCTTIAVMPVPVDGLGEAINDRLRRAAAPR